MNTLYDRLDQNIKDEIVKQLNVSYDALEYYVNNGNHTNNVIEFNDKLKQIDRRLKLNKIKLLKNK